MEVWLRSRKRSATVLIVLSCILSKALSCSKDYECPYGQCCSYTLGLVGSCTELSTVGQRCGTSVIALCGCVQGLVCVPKHGFLSTFTFGEGHCQPESDATHQPDVNATTEKPGGLFSLFG